MRVAIIGQQPFGKAVLDAFIARGDTVAGVFCAPDKAGSAADPLRTAAVEREIPVVQLTSLRTPQAKDTLRSMAVDLGVMAYVLQFAPEDFTSIPTHGTIQYHPSLLPRHRGPSSVNWPIILGETETGLTIFRPTEGLDEGPVILQLKTPIGPDETLGQVYFGRLFPLGVQALLDAADLVMRPGFSATPQESSDASYEGWCRPEEARVNWHEHADRIYDLIRGCDPAPGAWTTVNGKKLQLFDARKTPVRSFSQVAGKVGTVAGLGERGLIVVAHGAQLEIARVRYDGGAKMTAAEFSRAHGFGAGTVFDAQA